MWADYKGVFRKYGKWITKDDEIKSTEEEKESSDQKDEVSKDPESEIPYWIKTPMLFNDVKNN